MLNRNALAKYVFVIKANGDLPQGKLKELFNMFKNDLTLDRSMRGHGNKAMRRMGEAPRRNCGCDTCVIYGGDCAWQMYREEHDAWHKSKRGVKTRGN